jgi:hypothetical protein
MDRRRAGTAWIAVLWTLALASPVSAHGDHDARPLARDLAAGPYTISLWQVYAEASTSMVPHLIVLFDGVTVAPAGVSVGVAVNARAMAVTPSNTTANGFETMEGVDQGDLVAVTISSGDQVWTLDPVVVPAPPTSLLPMEELVYGSILLTIATAWWALGRTARAFRRPAPRTA